MQNSHFNTLNILFSQAWQGNFTKQIMQTAKKLCLTICMYMYYTIHNRNDETLEMEMTSVKLQKDKRLPGCLSVLTRRLNFPNNYITAALVNIFSAKTILDFKVISSLIVG